MGSEPNPYAAPQSAWRPMLPGVRFLIRPYASGITRANWTLGLLGFGILLTLSYMGTEVLELGILNRERAGDHVPLFEVVFIENAMEIIVGVQVLVLISTAVAFLMWFHRAYRNLPALGARNLRFSPAWAVGYFFLPILSLFRPYQAAREIWIASDPEVDATAAAGAWRSGPAAPVVGWWWLMFIISGFVGMASGFLENSEDLSTRIAASWMGIAASVMDILSALFAIAMIRRVAANQEAKNRRFGDAGADSPG